jgi:hypothetical protein|tara:strand:- start:86 stop:1300 length:1215 start_codon:yes stop_codon:yes gene_type:complete
MKNLLFTLALLISFTSFGQTWKYSEGGNAFDGKYKTSSVSGVGTKYPYTSPTLVINKFEGRAINFYISDGGFFQEKTGIGVLWVFDNEPNKRYSTYDYSISSDGKILFFTEFNNPDGSGKLNPVDIIEKLTLANKVTVRMEDDYGSNDIVFSLSGSTKAVNFVIPKEERQQMIDSALAERNALSEVEDNNQLVLDDLIKIATEEKLSSSSLSSLKSTFEQNLGLSYYSALGTGKKYKSILLEGNLSDKMFESYGYVDVFYILDDGSKEKIYGSWTVEMDAPIFVRLKEEKAKEELELANKLENDNKHLDSLLSKYQRDDIVNLLMENITKASKKYSKEFNIQDAESIKITLSGYQYKKYWNCRVEILLNNGITRVIDNTYPAIYELEISNKDLKTLGGKAEVAF